MKLGYKPQFVVSNVGSDPTTVGGLLKAFSKGKAGSSLMEGMITDGYLPPTTDASNRGSSCSRRSTTSTTRRHAGYTGAQVGIVKNGAIKLVGQPLVTDDGNGAITPYTKPQPKPGDAGVLSTSGT